MKRYTYYIIVLVALVCSCTKAEFEFSGYPCYFVFNNSASQSPALASATNPASPGIFCRITLAGATHFGFETNQGLSDRVAMTAIDQQRDITLGVYNGTGIIVGYGNLSSPAVFYAYDSQCPNCFGNANLPRYALTMNTDGTAECGSCHRIYDMNNGGLVISGDAGEKLIRYHANAFNGVISVIN